MTLQDVGETGMVTSEIEDSETASRPSLLGGVVLIVGYVLILGLIAVVAWAVRFNLDNVDGISYISIARQYADGSFDTAINAYWSPFITWAASVGIRAGLTGQFAIVVMNAIAAALGLAVGTLFVWWRTGKRFFPAAIFLVTFGAFAAGNVDLLTPDMLVAVWVLGFVILMLHIDEGHPGSTRRQQVIAGLALGAFCALGYFIKLFLVPVFVVSLVGWLVLRAVRGRRVDIGAADKASARSWGVTLVAAAAALVLIASPWVALISAKYDTFTVGSSFAVNLERKFDPNAALPPAPSGGHDIETPPNDRAISFGEDRTAQAGEPTGPQGSWLDRAQFYVGQRLEALPWLINKIGTIAPLAVPLMCAVAVGFIGGFLSFRRHREVLMIFMVFGVYFLGYAAITTVASGGGNSRYYWPLLVLGTLSSALLLPWLWARVRTGGWWRRALVIVIATLVPLGSVWEHGLGRAGPFTAGPSPLGIVALIQQSGIPLEQQLVDDQIKDDVPPGSRIMGSNYRRTLKFAFYLERVQIYGRAEQGYNVTDPAFQDAMRAAGIDYYFQFTPATLTPPDLSSLGEVVDSFEYFGPCLDTATALDEQCLIQLVKVSP